MQYARDNLDLDPGWHYSPGCDSDGDFRPDPETGLCPECAAKAKEAKEEQEAPDDE